MPFSPLSRKHAYTTATHMYTVQAGCQQRTAGLHCRHVFSDGAPCLHTLTVSTCSRARGWQRMVSVDTGCIPLPAHQPHAHLPLCCQALLVLVLELLYLPVSILLQLTLRLRAAAAAAAASTERPESPTEACNHTCRVCTDIALAQHAQAAALYLPVLH
jgi:hypothetical protein